MLSVVAVLKPKIRNLMSTKPLKLYASKVDTIPHCRKLIEAEVSRHLSKPRVTVLPMVDFVLKLPPGQDDWEHKLKGSFIEYTLAHLLGARDRAGEVRKITKVTPEQKEQFKTYFDATVNIPTQNCINALLACSLSHYMGFGSKKLEPTLLDFYINACADPVGSPSSPVVGLDLAKLRSYTNSWTTYAVTTGESVSTPSIGGTTDFIARKGADIIILDSKYRTESNGVGQLLIYAALLFEKRGEQATKLGIINPKKGEIVMHSINKHFYLDSSRLLKRLVGEENVTNQINEREVLDSTKIHKTTKNKSASPRPVTITPEVKDPRKGRARLISVASSSNSKKSKGLASSREDHTLPGKVKKSKEEEAKMGWLSWLAYKIFEL